MFGPTPDGWIGLVWVVRDAVGGGLWWDNPGIPCHPFGTIPFFINVIKRSVNIRNRRNQQIFFFCVVLPIELPIELSINCGVGLLGLLPIVEYTESTTPELLDSDRCGHTPSPPSCPHPTPTHFPYPAPHPRTTPRPPTPHTMHSHHIIYSTNCSPCGPGPGPRFS